MRLILLLFFALPAWAGTLTGKIVGISDGDTVTLLDATNQQHKLRLQGIDAPEKAQPFGQKSKQHLADMIHGKTVTAECGKIDKYRRQVCKIVLDGRDINLAQIGAGMAWWYRDYAKEQSASDRAVYEAAETRAKEAKLGLWADAAPVPPWNWRKNLAR
jgi:endonuclease YncB( thermonuclease family)